jgi:membrane complex biogenesis BtpA family protein
VAWLEDLFGTVKPVIGMVHLLPLPGSPQYDAAGGMERIVAHAEADVHALQRGGVNGLMFGNEADRPYQLRVDPASSAAMAYVIGRLAPAIRLPFGVDLLWDPEASIAVAASTGAAWVREVFTGVYASDMGLWQPDAAAALRYRRLVGAGGVRLFYNVCAEFASPLGSRPLGVVARSAVFSSLADAVCVSGPLTGEPAEETALAEVRAAVPDVPVIANTGVTVDNVAANLAHADAAIVGTHFKSGGVTWNAVDPDRVCRFMDRVRELRAGRGSRR